MNITTRRHFLLPHDPSKVIKVEKDEATFWHEGASARPLPALFLSAMGAEGSALDEVCKRRR